VRQPARENCFTSQVCQCVLFGGFRDKLRAARCIGINYESSAAVEVLLAALCYCISCLSFKIRLKNITAHNMEKSAPRESERARAFVLLKT
jgi:hypothetical protein